MRTTLPPLLSVSLVLLAALSSVRAHGHIVSWNVGGQNKPGFNPYWTSELGPTAERPTDNTDEGWADYWSPIVACGGMSAPNNVLTWDVQAGSTVVANWDEWDWGHRGPVIEYMARCPDSGCSGIEAWSLKWFKISQKGWDGKEFASETITRTRSWSFQIPSEIAPGNYLVRHEIIAMHRPNEPQVYPVCFQANVKSSGNLQPTDTVSFPGAYNQNDDFKSFNLYWGSDFNKFTPPGPAVFNRNAAQAAAPAPAPAPAPSSSSAQPVPANNAKTTATAPAATNPLITSGAIATGAAGHCRRSRKRVVRRF